MTRSGDLRLSRRVVEKHSQFSTDYPDATQIVLTQNYRSGQAILNRAHQFIQSNNPDRLEAEDPERLSKRLKANVDFLGTVSHEHFATSEDEADGITRMILREKEKDATLTWNEFAILVRSNDAATLFVHSLSSAGIPHQFMAMRGLYTKSIVLDTVALLRFIENPYDSVSLYRVRTTVACNSNTIARLNHYE